MPPNAGVVVGPYALEIGRPAGTILSQSASPDEAAADALAQALREQELAPEPEKTATETVGDLVDEASTATAKVERAVTIGKGAAAGNVLDPAQLGLEADALLDLLERLDRQGRGKEALRLARALSKLYSLLRRWAELLRALQAALRAGEKLGDLKAIGWAKHELGTLQLAGGDVDGAERTLGEAREIRRGLGDRAELAATEHNLHMCWHRLHANPPSHVTQVARTLGLTPALVAGTLLFCVGIAAGTAIGGGSGGEAKTITQAGDSTDASNATSTQTETRTVTETEPTTVTVYVESPEEPPEEASPEEVPSEEASPRREALERELPEEESAEGG